MNLRIIVIMFLLPVATFAQELTELDRRGGFKDIRVASPIDSVKGAEFRKDIKVANKPDLKLYRVEHPDYSTIGEIPVHRIEITAFDGLIYEITVITAKDTRLMKGLETALGPAAFNARENTYSWAGKNLSLTFSSHSKSQLSLLYRSVEVEKLMARVKEEKIEDIANDF